MAMANMANGEIEKWLADKGVQFIGPKDVPIGQIDEAASRRGRLVLIEIDGVRYIYKAQPEWWARVEKTNPR